MIDMPGRHNLQDSDVSVLNGIKIGPFVQLAYPLIDKERRMGGNMFRHCMSVFSILIDYGYTDHILLKSAIIHDIIEDLEGVDINYIKSQEDGEAILKLVLEVSKQKGESKTYFLTRIRNEGSFNAKVLKLADRISNLISLGQIIDLKFVERYLKETENCIIPWAGSVNPHMLEELSDLIKSRRVLLQKCPELK
jgi:(p)ppGpp synthase/HD superfamily hydrolase